MGTEARKLTKNEKRRLRQKAGVGSAEDTMQVDKPVKDDVGDIKVEYVSAAPLAHEAVDDSDIMAQFQAVFEKFATPEELTSSALGVVGKDEDEDRDDVDDEEESDEEGGPKKLSKKKKKLASRLSVAELKQLVHRPDVVEAHDVTSSDPRLLVHLKAYRNTVPVPRHWCHKRKYLQGKRGIEKPPFQLPEFIADTGIAKIRASVLEQEALKKNKQKARDRLQPKMGKIDIDYQVLHDAFFKYQKKPKMTNHGDLYYEGKEFEVNLKEKKPGFVSEELRVALGMTGVMPPPWLINMQRYGPPPSYPSLRIPGLSAPLPEGAAFGYHPGGWGKPPVDEYGQPLYGDVFGSTAGDDGMEIVVDRTRWGEFDHTAVEEESDEDEDEEASEGSAEEPEDDATASGMDTPLTFDGTSSMISGMETPDAIDLRKRTGLETPGGETPKELFLVIQERAVDVSGSGQIFGSDKAYAVHGDDKMDDNDDDGVMEKGGDSVDARGKRKRRPESSTASSSGAAAKKQKEFKF